jgi:hypothetical protein
MGFWKSNYSEPTDSFLRWIVKGVVTCGSSYISIYLVIILGIIS